ncbi:MAG: hypothetical protein PVJ98_01880 [Akkermansiaceae bacterium]|jgi:hypothetical protein
MKDLLAQAIFSKSSLVTVIALLLGFTVGRLVFPADQNLFGSDGSSDSGSFSSSVSVGGDSTNQETKTSSGGVRRGVTQKFSRSPEERREILAEVLNEGNPLTRTREMLDLIDGLSNDELAELVGTFRESGWVDFNRGEYSLLISSWMSRAPFEALAYLDENDPDGWTRKIAVSSWATDDPDAAAAAIEGLSQQGQVNNWMIGLVEGMARNDPERALALVQNLEDGETAEQALREVIPEVVVRGHEFATEWMEQLTNPDLQRDAAKRIASSMGRRDPEAASLWAGRLETSALRQEASGVIAEVFAREDLDGAKNWVLELPEDSVASAASNVARLLTRESPTEAARWLEQLGDAPALDGARVRFLQEAGRQDPETAIEQVANLSRAKDQERYYRDILNQWRRQDQQAAVAWASSHAESIPAKVLRSILPRQR